jgi:hypothetical protein
VGQNSIPILLGVFHCPIVDIRIMRSKKHACSDSRWSQVRGVHCSPVSELSVLRANPYNHTPTAERVLVLHLAALLLCNVAGCRGCARAPQI